MTAPVIPSRLPTMMNNTNDRDIVWITLLDRNIASEHESVGRIWTPNYNITALCCFVWKESINSHGHVHTAGSRCLLYHGTPGGLHRWRLLTPVSIFRMCVTHNEHFSESSHTKSNQKLDLATKLMMDEQTIKTGSLWITMWKIPVQSFNTDTVLKVAVGTKKIPINPMKLQSQDFVK